MKRVALGIAYRGSAYRGWQSQRGGQTVQDHVDAALSAFAAEPVRCVCAGRTDAGVHALNQVVHIDTVLDRADESWLRGTNRFLPPDIAVQWVRVVDEAFHARNSAKGRRYAYVLLESRVRPSMEAGQVGWSFRPLDGERMRIAAKALVGEHDFSAFRSAECQSPTPVKTLHEVRIERRSAYWRFDFDGDGFLHHMIRNIMGSLLAIGSAQHEPHWMSELLASKNRALAAPTFSPDGLYFLGPYYDAAHAIPDHTPAMDWLP